jgi:hypothetical protein
VAVVRDEEEEGEVETRSALKVRHALKMGEELAMGRELVDEQLLDGNTAAGPDARRRCLYLCWVAFIAAQKSMYAAKTEVIIQ